MVGTGKGKDQVEGGKNEVKLEGKADE